MKTLFKKISLLQLILATTVLCGANRGRLAMANPVPPPENETAATQRKAFTGERYECQQVGDKYSTIAHTERGAIEIIVWESKFFGAKWTPAARCQAVSKRFQSLSDQGRLKYLNAGRMNYENVICITSKTGKEGCLKDGLLLTLEPKDNPFDVLDELIYSRKNPSAGGTRRNNGKPIDFVRLLNERAPMAQSSAPNTPDVSPSGKEQPVPGQPIPWGQ